MNKQLLNLQRFGEGEGEAPGAAAPEGTADGAETKGGKEAASDDTNAPAKKYTDEDVNRIIDQKFAKWQKDQEAKISEAEKMAKMDAQQKAEYERDELQKKLDALEGEKALADMTRTARSMLKANGVDPSDEILALLVTTDAETTKAAVDSYAELFKAAVDSAVKDALKGNTPKSGSGQSILTREQIMAVANKAERQRLIAENIELFR